MKCNIQYLNLFNNQPSIIYPHPSKKPSLPIS